MDESRYQEFAEQLNLSVSQLKELEILFNAMMKKAREDFLSHPATKMTLAIRDKQDADLLKMAFEVATQEGFMAGMKALTEMIAQVRAQEERGTAPLN